MKTTQLQATWPFQALSDDTRIRVVRLLASTGAKMAPGQLTAALGIKPSHLSRHLQVLVWADLITYVRQGRTSLIAIREGDASVDAICSAVISVVDKSGTFNSDMESFAATTNPASWL